ncbi:CBM35 domain-containing protein [Streptomyces sp. NRRL S-87]|uniref:CBM35 domain-containing protein n=1 Tax=Streptomyces sp. NRRL S-87 TaxID=1463920 RepID=UPI0004C17116|nr:CBM35 domain-containing protein [Streptomyces sp. NRRL S-87]
MTPANNGPNNGAPAADDDDPFGYLYADGKANGAVPPAQGGGYGYPGPGGQQPGVPRRSYNQVRTVGERQYGGQRPVPQQQPHQPHYPAPETLQSGYGVPPQQSYGQQPPQRHAPQGGGHGGGSSRRGLLIGAVAVVGAVVIGISVAIITGNKDKDKGANPDAPSDKVSQAPATPGKDKDSDKDSDSDSGELPKADAASGKGLALAGGATVQNTIPGAKGKNGQYVGGFNAVGASVTWTVDVKEAGKYVLHMTYAVPGTDANATLTVNGQAQSRAINMKNWANAGAGAWDKGWTNTYSNIELNKGTNTVKVSCEQGNSCDAIIDQLWIATK